MNVPMNEMLAMCATGAIDRVLAATSNQIGGGVRFVADREMTIKVPTAPSAPTAPSETNHKRPIGAVAEIGTLSVVKMTGMTKNRDANDEMPINPGVAPSQDPRETLPTADHSGGDGVEQLVA